MIYKLRINIKTWLRLRRGALAFLLMKWAGHVDSRAVELVCYNYVEAHYDDFQEWSLEKAYQEYER